MHVVFQPLKFGVRLVVWKTALWQKKAKGKEIYAGLDRPRLRPPEFLENHRMKLARLSALHLYKQGNASGPHFW